MPNYNILEKFLDIMENTMFSKSVLLDFTRIIYNDSDSTPFWNFALIDQILDKNKIIAIEEKLKSLNRKPAIYFENTNLFIPLIGLLEKDGYRLNNEDSWMFYKNKVTDTSGFDKIKRVGSPEDLKIWLNTLNGCYRTNDPQNPYGELGVYVSLAERAWKSNNLTSKFEYFIAFKEMMPVAVATLTYEKDLGYISNVGSIQEVRGQGYGKLITLFCVYQAQKRDTDQICLATERGTFPNIFYKKLGFKTRFTARCYVKD